MSGKAAPNNTYLHSNYLSSWHLKDLPASPCDPALYPEGQTEVRDGAEGRGRGMGPKCGEKVVDHHRVGLGPAREAAEEPGGTNIGILFFYGLVTHGAVIHVSSWVIKIYMV